MLLPVNFTGLIQISLKISVLNKLIQNPLVDA